MPEEFHLKLIDKRPTLAGSSLDVLTQKTFYRNWLPYTLSHRYYQKTHGISEQGWLRKYKLCNFAEI